MIRDIKIYNNSELTKYIAEKRKAVCIYYIDKEGYKFLDKIVQFSEFDEKFGFMQISEKGRDGIISNLKYSLNKNGQITCIDDVRAELGFSISNYITIEYDEKGNMLKYKHREYEYGLFYEYGSWKSTPASKDREWQYFDNEKEKETVILFYENGNLSSKLLRNKEGDFHYDEKGKLTSKEHYFVGGSGRLINVQYFFASEAEENIIRAEDLYFYNEKGYLTEIHNYHGGYSPEKYDFSKTIYEHFDSKGNWLEKTFYYRANMDDHIKIVREIEYHQ